MEMDAQIARERGISTNRRRAAGQTNKMTSRPRVNWGFRIGLTLSLVIGAAWGFALGILLVRVNAQLSTIAIVGAALPAAFFGSMIVGLLFNALVRAWHKAARLLAALLIVALGMPLGLGWGLAEQRLDAIQLVNATGALIWNMEWLLAIVGLIGGMWPGWARPFLQTGWRVPQFLLESLAQFFETLGHAFLWLPGRLLRMIRAPFQNARRLWDARPTRLPRAPAPRIKRRRLPKLHAPALRRRSTNEGLRVVGVIEDRCPYCLDIVKRNDPRGVRVCEVCGTPHHADCWSITGKCQVPHLNT